MTVKTYIDTTPMRAQFASAALSGMLANNDGMDRIWEAAKKKANVDKDLAADICEDFFVSTSLRIAQKMIVAIGDPGSNYGSGL